MIITKHILGFLLLIIMISCSKDDAPAPIPNPADAIYRIKQTTYPLSGNSSTYEYNAQNKMTKRNNYDGSFIKWNYNSQGQLVSQENGGNVDVSYNSMQNYVYNATGAKIEDIYTRGDGTKYKFVYTNNSNNLPITLKYFYLNITTNTWIESASNNVVYTYNNNNQIIRLQRESDYYLNAYDSRGNQNENRQYNKKPDGSFYLRYQSNSTYDDKKTPQTNPIAYGVNNAIDAVSKTFLEDGSLSNQSSTTFTYEYNEAGYVTKQFYNGVLNVTYTLEKIN